MTLLQANFYTDGNAKTAKGIHSAADVGRTTKSLAGDFNYWDPKEVDIAPPPVQNKKINKNKSL